MNTKSTPPDRAASIVCLSLLAWADTTAGLSPLRRVFPLGGGGLRVEINDRGCMSGTVGSDRKSKCDRGFPGSALALWAPTCIFFCRV
jgi:hypothetical protein